MKNKPVAWMETYKGEPNNLDCDKSNLNYGDEFHDVVPLYTHPAKTLTDEEILKLYVNNSTYDNDQKLFIDIYGFARAILRKAQEK